MNSCTYCIFGVQASNTSKAREELDVGVEGDSLHILKRDKEFDDIEMVRSAMSAAAKQAKNSESNVPGDTTSNQLSVIPEIGVPGKSWYIYCSSSSLNCVH